MVDSVPLRIVFSLVLLILNLLVVLSNGAFESISRSKIRQMIDEMSDNKARRVLNLVDNPTKFRFANSLMNYVFVTSGTLLIWNLGYERFSRQLFSAFAYVALAVSMSYIFPRKLSMQHSESIVKCMAGLQTVMYGVLFPITFLMTLIPNLVLIIFRQEINVDDNEFSEEDVMSMLEEGEESGAIMEEGRKMIGSIFRFDDERAYEIMTPRTDVFLIDLEDDPEEYIDKVLEMKYSRIPVCQGDSDNILGVLHIKDYVVAAKDCGFKNVDIKSILREPCLVPETKNIASLFIQLQQERKHISILIDEYGGFSGIVTMEDIIEEILGEIDDEYDQEQEAEIIEKINDNTWLVAGNVAIDDFNEEAGTELDSETSETIGGFIIDLIGEIPNDGYINRDVETEKYLFNILSVHDRRIEKVRITVLNDGDTECDEER